MVQTISLIATVKETPSDRPLCNFGASKSVPEQHKIRRFPDFKALKLGKG